jgi:hypothetical protein
MNRNWFSLFIIDWIKLYQNNLPIHSVLLSHEVVLSQSSTGEGMGGGVWNNHFLHVRSQ